MKAMRLTILAMFLLLFSTIALAACGGGDDSDGDDSGNDDPAAATTAAAEDEPDATPEEEDATPAEEAPGEEEGGDDSGGGSAEALSDPCSLISQSDAAAALGEEMQEPVVTYTGTANVGLTSAQATVSTCSYLSSGFSSISLTVWSAPGEDEAIQSMGEEACRNKESAGVGELSCWYDDTNVEIVTVDGGHFLDIFLTSPGDPTPVLESLAATAVGNLP